MTLLPITNTNLVALLTAVGIANRRQQVTLWTMCYALACTTSVLCMSNGLEMSRIHAAAIEAEMVNFPPVRDRSNEGEVGPNMSESRLGLVDECCVAVRTSGWVLPTSRWHTHRTKDEFVLDALPTV